MEKNEFKKIYSYTFLNNDVKLKKWQITTHKKTITQKFFIKIKNMFQKKYIQ